MATSSRAVVADELTTIIEQVLAAALAVANSPSSWAARCSACSIGDEAAARAARRTDSSSSGNSGRSGVVRKNVVVLIELKHRSAISEYSLGAHIIDK